MKKTEFNNLLKDLKKTYGEETVMTVNGKNVRTDIEHISTGSLLVDDAIGIGGYPKGRIIEVYGPESSGKTTMALLAIAEAQKQGGYAAFVDAEHAFDVKHAKNLGVDLDKMVVSQPDSGEQALELVDHLTSTGQFAIIVVDSVAALTPTVELEGHMQDQTIGAQARLMSKSLRKLAGVINKTNTIVLFINQIREKVGVIFGNPEVTPGGRGLKFAASVRLDIRIRERIKEKDRYIGQRIKVKVVKNKVGSPYQEIETVFYYEGGINQAEELVELASTRNIITKAGSWYSYNGVKLGQGKVDSAKALVEQGILEEVKDKTFNYEELAKQEEVAKEKSKDKPSK